MLTSTRDETGQVLTWTLAGWAVAYGGLRLAWTVGEAPSFPPFGTDLLGFTGWSAVVLCVVAGVLGLALNRATTWQPLLAGAAWSVAGALTAAAGILLPELVGMLLLSLGPHFDPLAFASRLGCVAGAALLALATAAYQRRTRGDCPACCRTGRPGARTGATERQRGRVERQTRVGPARWALLAAHAAVTGLVVRFAAQAVVGFGQVAQTTPLIALEVGMLLAGVLLPLALVHSWGRVWPRWVPLLAGRSIPRLLLLIPGFGLGIGLVSYFGMGMVQLASGSVSQFSDTFLLTAMSAYCLWGLGLIAASADYHLRTRRACPGCGR